LSAFYCVFIFQILARVVAMKLILLQTTYAGAMKDALSFKTAATILNKNACVSAVA